MRLERLKVTNLFSIGSIELNLKDRGLLLVTGHSYDEGSANGAGKSSLARNSIIWGLFGQIMGESKGDDVINRHTKGVSEVEIDFTSSGDLYRIVRTRNPSHVTLLKKDPKWLSIGKRLSKDTQKDIDLLLGKSFINFCQCDVFGQGRKKAFFELIPSEQKSVIEDILPMNDLTVWTNRTVEYRKEIKTELSIKHDHINVFKGKEEVLLGQMENIKQQYIQWDKDQLHHINKVKNLIKDLEKNKQEKDNLIHQYEGEIADIYSQGFVEKIKVFDLNLVNINVELQELSQKIINNKNKLEEENLNKSTSTCNSCGQFIPSDNMKKLTDERDQFNTREKFLLRKKQHTLQRLDRANKDCSSIEHCQNKIYHAREDSLNSQISEEKERLELLLSTRNTFKPLLDGIKTDWNNCKFDKEVITLAYDIQNKELEKLDIWYNAFNKDLRSLLFESACPFLEQRTNTYLTHLGNQQITVQFSTIKELKSGDIRDDFNVSVKSSTGGNTFSLLSGGEQQMVNFSVGMALSDLAKNQTGGGSDVMILDEPFTNLDPRNSENVVNFLTGYLSKERGTILLISNDSNIQSLISNKIRVEKKNGISKLGRYI
jgi:DNA repair exonuclease SbcCD ATPase subunit